MSEYGDEPCDVYNAVTRTAHKPHVCCACGVTIAPGERYTFTSMLWDGHWYEYKRCARCEIIFSHLSQRMRSEGDFEEFCNEKLACGHDYEERWEEPPPPWLAALAFWRPGEPLPDGCPEWVGALACVKAA